MKKLQQYSACLASAQPAAATSSALSAAHFTVSAHHALHVPGPQARLPPGAPAQTLARV